MKIKVGKSKKDSLEEISAMAGGAVEIGVQDEKVDEAFSTQGISGRTPKAVVSPEKEHAGHCERDEMLGNRSVVCENKKITLKVLTNRRK